MCQVTRVTNSCGHVNDHVFMTCRHAKKRSPSPNTRSRSFDGASNKDQRTTQLTNQSRPPNNNSTAPHHSAKSSSSSFRGSEMPLGMTPVTAGGPVVSVPNRTSESVLSHRSQSSGPDPPMILGKGEPGRTDAWSDPYCIDAEIKLLSSSDGFQCLVSGCSRDERIPRAFTS